MADEAHARGEPFWPQDFDPSPVPDAQNAGLTLRRAGNAIVIDSAYTAVENGTLSDPPSEADIRAIAAMMATNGLALQLARQAGLQTKVDWGIRPVSPVTANYPPPNLLTHQRNLASLVAWAVIHDHAIGDDCAAIQRIQDLIHQAHAVDAAAPCMVTHLVSLGITALATDRIQRVAPALAVGPGAPASAATPATRAQVENLIAELLDEDSFHEGASRSWYGERMMELDMVKHMYDGVSDPLLVQRSIKPMFDLDGVHLARGLTQSARAATQPNWPAARACIPAATQDDDSQIAQLSRYLSTIMAPATGRAITQEFRTQSDRHAAAIALAIRLYRIDHGEQYPPSLVDLVPTYLPGPPVDPMAGDGRPLGYKPKAAPPVIYSVGEDGKDEGGTSLPNEGPHGERWQQADAVYPLVPTTQPSSQTQNDQCNIQDGNRNRAANRK